MLLKYSRRNERKLIALAAEALRRGRLVVYPTDTVYGIGADAANAKAVARVYRLKRRPRSMPVSVMVSDKAMLREWAAPTRAALKMLPGKYTFVLRPKRRLPVSSGNVGFRIPKHWCAKIAKALGRPVVTTSANLTGKGTPMTASAVRRLFRDAVAVYIDGGRLAGKPSKVIGSRGKRIR